MRFRELAAHCGFDEELAWAEEIVSWPLEWSALHGIAEIKTPILKLAVRTDATVGKHVIRWHGLGLPAEAARGIGFAYRPPRNALTKSAGYRRGLDQELVALRPRR
jgi:hypothetical protein